MSQNRTNVCGGGQIPLFSGKKTGTRKKSLKWLDKLKMRGY